MPNTERSDTCGEIALKLAAPIRLNQGDEAREPEGQTPTPEVPSLCRSQRWGQVDVGFPAENVNRRERKDLTKIYGVPLNHLATLPFGWVVKISDIVSTPRQVNQPGLPKETR